MASEGGMNYKEEEIWERVSPYFEVMVLFQIYTVKTQVVLFVC